MFVRMIQDLTLSLPPEGAADRDALRRAVALRLSLSPSKVSDLIVTRRSIDARKSPVKVCLCVKVATLPDKKVSLDYTPVAFPDVSDSGKRVVIVGAGPAGLFAAMRAVELGMKPIVIERGKRVDDRRLDLTELSRNGIVDPESNYCFGEGGAGTFSDGKLFTRSRKRGNVRGVLELFVQHGADPVILVDSHPHIGSDRLPHIVKNIRQTIVGAGGEVLFETKVTRLILRDGKACGVMTGDGAIVEGDAVILATGHSARDVYRFLKEQGVAMEPKGIAVGVRLEHPQKLIDRIQYHSKNGRGKWLPPAEYNFVAQCRERGVYSFCMCPGGVVVPSASGPCQSVVNGMSASSRSSIWANSGMVVEIHPGDFPEFSGEGELEMLALQESLEKRFYEAAGNSVFAPAQRMLDFVNGNDSRNLPPSSYLPGLVPGRLDRLLPPFIAERLKEGFRKFGRNAKGFLTNEATVIGLESRTSSPVRIPRDKESLQHVEISGLFPAGEGAGYSGGIVSAAIDGRRCAEAAHSMICPDDVEMLSK